jgi:hypothetical protein
VPQWEAIALALANCERSHSGELFLCVNVSKWAGQSLSRTVVSVIVASRSEAPFASGGF